MRPGAEASHIVLASGSAARRELLSAAGVAFGVHPADIDEASLHAALAEEHAGDLTPESVAIELACAKASAVSRERPGALVIGADQVLDFAGRVVTKSRDMAEARDLLVQLRGHTHALHSAFALARDGHLLCYHCDTAHLTMRAFSDPFLDGYLAEAGETILACVGCYQLEGRGLQLFEAIEGDYFTILGLPMLPLLAELRARGALAT